MKEPRQLHGWSSTNAAFSLIELLVVIAILVILTSLYWNHGPSKRDAQLESCKQNLERIYVAMETYAVDFKGKYPVATNAQTSEDVLGILVPRYTSDTSIFICPATKRPQLAEGQTFSQWKISYAYYMGEYSTNTDAALMSDEQVSTFSKSQGAMAFSSDGRPPGNNHGKGGGNFMTCDGTVVSSSGTAPLSLRLSGPVTLLNPKP